MLEKDKVGKGQDIYSPDSHDGNYARCKTPSSLSAADMPTTAQILISFRKNPCVLISQNTAIDEKLVRGNVKRALFIPIRP